MPDLKINYLYRAWLCIIIFFLAILSAHDWIQHSIEYIISFSANWNERAHACFLFLIPLYLAIIIFGFGTVSVYCAVKLDQFFNQPS